MPLNPTTRHTLSWITTSMTTLAAIAAANEAPYLLVNVAV